jgi:response regulator of citrate/malate metabolism
MEHDVEHAKKVGFVCHLIKPVHIESLEEALNVFIRMCDKPLKRGLGRSASGYCFV